MIELILTFALLIGSHETGHGVEASRLNVPVKWSYSVTGVVQDYGQAPHKDIELITNAAFVSQDAIGYALGDESYNRLNGAYKIAYLARDTLDMNNITKETKFMIGLSGALNLLGYDYRFVQFNNDTTGILKTWRF